jgi:hypothetical protein
MSLVFVYCLWTSATKNKRVLYTVQYLQYSAEKNKITNLRKGRDRKGSLVCNFIVYFNEYGRSGRCAKNVCFLLTFIWHRCLAERDILGGVATAGGWTEDASDKDDLLEAAGDREDILEAGGEAEDGLEAGGEVEEGLEAGGELEDGLEAARGGSRRTEDLPRATNMWSYCYWILL